MVAFRFEPASGDKGRNQIADLGDGLVSAGAKSGGEVGHHDAIWLFGQQVSGDRLGEFEPVAVFSERRVNPARVGDDGIGAAQVVTLGFRFARSVRDAACDRWRSHET